MNFEDARDVVGTEIGRIRGVISTLEKSGLADDFVVGELRKTERRLSEALPALRRRIDEG